MIDLERPYVFPLRITDFVSVSNCDPSILEYALAVTNEGLSKPWNHLARFGPSMSILNVRVRQRDVERILERGVTEPLTIKRTLTV